MPFVSSSLTTHPQADGSFTCHERHVDSVGEVWSYTYGAPTVAAAEAIRDARFAATQYERRQSEIRRVVDHFESGGTWAGFTIDHFVTKDKLKIRILKLFRTSRYPEALGYARAVAVMTIPQIASLLSVANPEANSIQDRADAVIAHDAADSNWDNDLVDDDGTE